MGRTENTSRIIGMWLLGICAMVFAMVVLGGFTRLTESGLSMTDWRPITGWLPPLDDLTWQVQFDGYRESPEYRKINAGMTLEQFKEIFWLEYLHRLWGRLIGLVFAVPFVFFVVKRWIDRATMIRLLIMFVLGGLQGLVGWWMVKSGLVDHPDVSQYRLAVHLMLAFVILGLGLWFAFDLLGMPRYEVQVGQTCLSSTLIGMVFLTIFSGALVAGLNAGLIYNTFPLMLGEFFPSEGFQLAPWYLNFFEDIPTVQFDHRWLAVSTLLIVAINWLYSRRCDGQTKFRANFMLGIGVVQIGLGISTLLLMVPISLAAAHQAGAVLLFACSIWYRHGIRGVKA